MKLVKKTGIFTQDGGIDLHPDFRVSWKYWSDKIAPELPSGTPLNIDVSLDVHSLLSGEYGIVWATWDARQADVLHNTLLAQNITAVIRRIEMEEGSLLLMVIENRKDIGEAQDFIWRKKTGLRLKPDWSYPVGEANQSFEKWVNG